MILNLPGRRLSVANIPDPADANIVVPPTLQPVTELPALLTTFISGSGFSQFQGPTVTESGLFNIERTQPASQPAVAIGVCTFLKGLYRIRCQLTGLAAFTPATPIDQLQLTSASGTAGMNVLKNILVANVPGYRSTELLLNFAEDTWSLDMWQSATGVGQTIFSSCFIEVRRLA